LVTTSSLVTISKAVTEVVNEVVTVTEMMVAVVVAVVAVGDREVTEDVEAEDKVLCRE
jgi:hypothetical protein